MTATTEIVHLSAVELAELIKSGKISCLEVVMAFLNHIKIHNKALNAFVTIDAKGAVHRAKQADEALARGEIWGVMHGVPVTIKDQFATKNIRTTASLPQYYKYIPDDNAVAVSRWLDAGAIILGKTNLPPMAMDYQTRSPISGVTNNPWNIAYTSGGSSGGGAAAVAAGMSPLDLASDLGGSIRLPAGFCGIFGMKATENSIPGEGAFPNWPDSGINKIRHMLSYGPLARSVGDLRLGLSVMAGLGNNPLATSQFSGNKVGGKKRSDISIAFIDDFGQMPIDPEVKHLTRRAIEKVEKEGIHVKYENFHHIDFESVRQLYEKIMDMEFGTNLKPLQRVRFYLLGKRKRKKIGMENLAYPITYKKYIRILSEKECLATKLEILLSKHDVLICPISPMTAFKHHSTNKFHGIIPIYDPLTVDGNKVNYWKTMGHFTILFNLTGNPVVVVPVGVTGKGLPVGVQIVAKKWQDMKLLDIAEELNKIIDGFRRPPVDSL
ncbi:MAG: amidase [Proteobacteria bacterium]|nr:amidase [Pseudomonadota bacterium]MBU1585845.1 amidase [Pseudomonadota bacterium]MBU2451785.1 amidase [Pseudomonadota bacterium]